MKYTITLFLLLTSLFGFSQKKLDKLARKATEEGMYLYKLEMTAWHGTDIVLAKYEGVRKILGGYFAYGTQSGSRCVFYDRSETPKVIATVDFDSTLTVKSAQSKEVKRSFTNKENALYALRNRTYEAVRKDTIFKFYKNTSLNIIPIVRKKERKVYILTAPKKTGVMIIGNDYLLSFNKRNKLKKIKKLHKSMLVFETDGTRETMHSHLPEYDQIMTPTDICTLMLYGKYTKWKQHIVASHKYTSFWNIEKNKLFVMTTKAIKKINEDQKKRKKD